MPPDEVWDVIMAGSRSGESLQMSIMVDLYVVVSAREPLLPLSVLVAADLRVADPTPPRR